MKVGIETIAFHSPEHYIELADLANARDVDPDKFIKGLGQVRMAVATPMEDTVTLAINAALKALENFDIDYNDIGTLVVGTESGVMKLSTRVLVQWRLFSLLMTGYPVVARRDQRR
jgi:hydroxymethylglutaryl-CoA synthase